MNRYLAIAILAWAAPVAAQLPSNATLSGAYYFRYLGVIRFPSDTTFSAQGTVTFDGIGGFTVKGTGVSSRGASLGLLSSGKYSVISSGILSMTNPSDSSGSTKLVGGLGAGAVVASSAGAL